MALRSIIRLAKTRADSLLRQHEKPQEKDISIVKCSESSSSVRSDKQNPSDFSVVGLPVNNFIENNFIRVLAEAKLGFL